MKPKNSEGNLKIRNNSNVEYNNRHFTPHAIENQKFNKWIIRIMNKNINNFINKCIQNKIYKTNI